jgi:hypothetical protein
MGGRGAVWIDDGVYCERDRERGWGVCGVVGGAEVAVGEKPF